MPLEIQPKFLQRRALYTKIQGALVAMSYLQYSSVAGCHSNFVINAVLKKMPLMLVNRNIHIVRSVRYCSNCYSTLFGTAFVSSEVYTECIVHRIQSRRKYTYYFLHLMLYTAFKLLEFTFLLSQQNYILIMFLREKMEKRGPKMYNILQEMNQLFKSSFTCVCKSELYV